LNRKLYYNDLNKLKGGAVAAAAAKTVKIMVI
jgi:hypothetical protein